MSTRRRKPRRNRVFVFAGLLLLPMLGLGAWLAMTIYSDDEDRLSPILKEYGYTTLTPPSRLFGPGTFVTVETLKNGALKLHLACNMDHVALAAMWERSDTIDRSLTRRVKSTFDSSTNALKLITSRGKGSSARTDNVVLRDISIVTLPYESLFGLRSQYLRDACEKAIVWNLLAGASVCQTEEALEADVVYSTQSEYGIDAGLEFERPEEARGSLEADRRASNEGDMHGDDLILGVRVRPSNCLLLEASGQRISAGRV